MREKKKALLQEFCTRMKISLVAPIQGLQYCSLGSHQLDLQCDIKWRCFKTTLMRIHLHHHGYQTTFCFPAVGLLTTIVTCRSSYTRPKSCATYTAMPPEYEHNSSWAKFPTKKVLHNNELCEKKQEIYLKKDLVVKRVLLTKAVPSEAKFRQK